MRHGAMFSVGHRARFAVIQGRHSVISYCVS